jgi:hypothetical protein
MSEIDPNLGDCTLDEIVKIFTAIFSLIRRAGGPDGLILINPKTPGVANARTLVVLGGWDYKETQEITNLFSRILELDTNNTRALFWSGFHRELNFGESLFAYCFPTARERIDSVAWLITTLSNYSIEHTCLFSLINAAF